MSARRWLLLLVLIIVVVVVYAFWSTRTPVVASSRNAQVERGRYLAIAGDCVACHKASLAGGLAINSPIGVIYSTNITPDRATGIGEYSLNDFNRAVRYGIRRDGTTLYPAMPYPSFSRMTDEDVAALYAYFMHGVAPVRLEGRRNEIPWPLSIRWPLAIWRKVFTQPAVFESSRYEDAVVARGAYLVQGLGHCGSCHTPRGRTLQELAMDDSRPAYLSGGAVVDGWVPVNLRGDQADGLGLWTIDDIVRSLRSGRNSRHAVIGSPMDDVVVHSAQHMLDSDLLAIATYLKTLPANEMPSATFEADPATARALASGSEVDRGAQLYVDNCAACHRTSGQGERGVFPSIAGNSSVLASNPDSLVHLILRGSSLPATATAPSTLGMPGFSWRLSDEEVAQLATFVRQSWGNKASSVDAGNVRRIRDATR